MPVDQQQRFCARLPSLANNFVQYSVEDDLGRVVPVEINGHACWCSGSSSFGWLSHSGVSLHVFYKFVTAGSASTGKRFLHNNTCR
jgi:hypothetical protein